MFGEDRLFQSILLASKYMSGGNREAPNMALQDTAARLIEYLGTFGRTFPTNLLNLASWTHRNRQPTTLVLFCRWKNFKVQDMAGFIERFAKLSGVLAVVGATVNGSVLPRASDPCAAISGQKWIAPRAVRDCYSTVKVNETLKNNVSHFHLFPSFLSDALAWQILDVVGRTLNFHTSVNYQIQAPPPFNEDVHEDLFKDLDRIRATNYASDYDMHVDLSRTLKRLNDGHCVWINGCYVSTSLIILQKLLILHLGQCVFLPYLI